MVNTLSGSVSAYRNEQMNKRYIHIEEVMSMNEQKQRYYVLCMRIFKKIFQNDVPSHDTFQRVMGMIEPSKI